MSRGEWPRLWKASRAKPARGVWGLLVCSAWRRESWGVTTQQLTASSRQAAEGHVLFSSLWVPPKEHKEMEWRCLRGNSDWILGESSYLRGWLVTGADRKESGMEPSLALQGMSEWGSYSYGLFTVSPVRSRVLDLVILTGFFQLEIFNDCKSATDGVALYVQLWDGDKMTTVTWFIRQQLEDQLQHAGSVGTLWCARP